MLACLPGGRMSPDVSKIHTNEIAPRRLRRELYAPVLISKPSAHLQKPSLQDIASARDALGGAILQDIASA
ncbi:MAG: hypothetical protein DMD78_16785 [Candidatus Rokuibacteriota bacterium]|nr:MAG: hypothetical protein DMD78_16785 [Candidatus Rokubacteria bacterium]